jgi:hypothetical protein
MALFNIELLEYALRPNCMQIYPLELFEYQSIENKDKIILSYCLSKSEIEISPSWLRLLTM